MIHNLYLAFSDLDCVRVVILVVTNAQFLVVRNRWKPFSRTTGILTTLEMPLGHTHGIVL